jgi:hypothetical protein
MVEVENWLNEDTKWQLPLSPRPTNVSASLVVFQPFFFQLRVFVSF